ncbi:hypothetical protein [Geothrix oryzisoli]|uniref:hypothetical protein n=1 Tax=Geothrix oryzisoli TaxID=2922721 RepID=UPI001FAC19D9|nr:hypothetical protein [Geothrix oryzisoli]
MDSEGLWRAALHDFNNLVTGLQGVADLGDPDQPFDPHNHARLETLVEEGKTLLAMARAMALGRIPDSEPMPWTDWEAGVRTRLDATGSLFHCPVDLVNTGNAGSSWPGPLLQDWVVAFTRQILPWAAPGPLRLEAEAGPEAWGLRWITDAALPLALEAEPPPDAPRSLAGLWLRGMASHLGLTVEPASGCLQVRLPRRNPESTLPKES